MALRLKREARSVLAPVARKDLEAVREDLQRDGMAIWDFTDVKNENPEFSFERFAEQVPSMVLGDACLATLAPTEIRMKISDDGTAEAVTLAASAEAKTHNKYGTASSAKQNKTTNQTLDPLHLDGTKVYGYQMPDFIFLVCERPCSNGGGANFAVEAEAVLASIRADPSEAWVADALFSTPVQMLYFSVTSTGQGRWVGPLAVRLPDGRLLLQCPNVFDAVEPRVRPVEDSQDPTKDQAMIDVFAKHMRQAMNKAARFHMSANQVLCVDNLGTSHGREPYEDLQRTLWRVWTWSSQSNGLPEGVEAGASRKRDCEV
ncbi:Hypothetical Protein FCC1311_069802 [Hondaea fermentalgiana]|uniref:TauD/TfdA-like domain-containing protein n=1 Tax=Hondaea fermentalgiana TaxID=2315210 RepID=A0A2R5GIP0_9STRA|nr:Hypothetical Protein FCC1311_069802 [Hondaea fermentalgiana]|eukprot:GBG30760.1 Hypothetical Protein FCC1311_069802 [Hondaea fermentalgiana]